MSTLTRVEGENPPLDTTLIGQVGEEDVVMSFDTIRKIARFDSKPDNVYVFPPEKEIFKKSTKGEEGMAMFRDLFIPSATRDMVRKDLKILAKIVAIIVGHNVIPRTSDKETI
jgi:hypothetical protein